MRRLLTMLLLMAAEGLAVHAALPVNWSTNCTAFLSVPGTDQPPLLVYFTASWCEPCKLTTQIVLTDPIIMQTLSNIDHVAVDIDEHADVAAKFGVQAVPTFVLLAAGQETDRATGFRPPAEFQAWLTNGINEARATAAKLTFARKELAEADRLLASAETNSARLAAAKLFDLCSLRDSPLVQSAVGRLNTLAAREPASVLDGLEDPRLATRIQTANVLRAALGESFDVDPWSETNQLQTVVQAWREKLSRPAK